MVHKNQKHIQHNAPCTTDVSRVFVVHNQHKNAFIEQFVHTSVNFTQKELGTLLGFFIVRDESATSENIVNFLVSEAKQKYFAHVDKSVEEKFEGTLHRVNRALEEIANLGNVAWLGTVEAAVCAITDTEVHFSVAGDAHILLLRDDTLIDISEGLASPDAAHHPLKTFADIASGGILPHDKIIITSRELLDLVSFAELEKNARRMGARSFVQFIETVLKNECVLASTIVVDVAQKDEPAPMIPTPQPEEETPTIANAFSSETFDKAREKKTAQHDADNDATQTDVTSYITDTQEEYTDPRTGHYYIKGSDEQRPPTPSVFDNFSDHIADFTDTFSHAVKKQRRALGRLFGKKDQSLLAMHPSEDDPTDPRDTDRVAEQKHVEEQPETPIIEQPAKEKIPTYKPSKTQTDKTHKEKAPQKTEHTQPKTQKPNTPQPAKDECAKDKAKERQKVAKKKTPQHRSMDDILVLDDDEEMNQKLTQFFTQPPAEDTMQPEQTDRVTRTLDKAKQYCSTVCTISKNATHHTTVHCKKICATVYNTVTKNKKTVAPEQKPQQSDKTIQSRISHFASRARTACARGIATIRRMWRAVPQKTRFIMLGIVVLLVIPLFFALLARKNNQNTTPENAVTPPAQHDTPAPSPEKPETRTSMETVHSGQDIRRVVFLKDTPISIEKTRIHIIGDKNYPLPSNSGAIVHATTMPDLNLIFFVTDTDRLFAFSPVDKKYTEQKNGPKVRHGDIVAINTYLTYLYIFSKDTITRYSRTTDGFLLDKQWLKDAFDFTSATSCAIDGNIFVTKDNTLTKFTKQKKAAFSLDATVTEATRAYTQKKLKNVWVLDAQKHTLYSVNKDTSKVTGQHDYGSIDAVTSFVISDDERTGFIATASTIYKIAL